MNFGASAQRRTIFVYYPDDRTGMLVSKLAAALPGTTIINGGYCVIAAAQRLSDRHKADQPLPDTYIVDAPLWTLETTTKGTGYGYVEAVARLLEKHKELAPEGMRDPGIFLLKTSLRPQAAAGLIRARTGYSVQRLAANFHTDKAAMEDGLAQIADFTSRQRALSIEAGPTPLKPPSPLLRVV